MSGEFWPAFKEEHFQVPDFAKRLVYKNFCEFAVPSDLHTKYTHNLFRSCPSNIIKYGGDDKH